MKLALSPTRIAVVFAAVALVSAATGCASQPPPAPTTSLTSADIARDPSWSPPDSSGIVLDEAKLPEPKEAAPRKVSARPLPSPNGRGVERKALHSAGN